MEKIWNVPSVISQNFDSSRQLTIFLILRNSSLREIIFILSNKKWGELHVLRVVKKIFVI